MTSAWARLLAPELLVDAGDVRLGRRLAQVELLADRGGAQAVGQQQQHLVLAVGEPGGLGGSPAHHRADQAGADERAGRDGGVPGRPDHLGGRGVLADEGGGAGLHGGEDLVVAGVHRDHHQSGRVADLADRADDVESGAVLELQVGDDHVGSELVVLLERLGHRAGRADDLMSVLAVEDARQPLADQLVVVDEEDAWRGSLVLMR